MKCKRALSLFLAALLLAGLLPALTASAADTLTERQQAVVAVALAYFDKGHPVQYGRAVLSEDVHRYDGGRVRQTACEAPEYATANETFFSVCTDFYDQVYWEAFRHHFYKDAAGACILDNILKAKTGDPIALYYWDKKSGKPVEEAIHEMFQLAQPGDVFTTYSTDGHTLIYLGDVYGDGVKYLAHCFGGRLNETTGRDGREYGQDDPDADPRYGINTYTDNNGGAIRLSPNAEQYYLKSYGKGNQVRMNLIRPLNVLPEECTITAATRYRISHPRLCIDRLVEGHSRFRSLYPGEKITLTVTLKNSSKQSYDLPVTEKIPAGVKLVKTPEGATVSGDEIKWNITLGAWEQKTLSCDYEVTAKRGEVVTFTGGSVGDIPSNTIPLTVGGAKLTAEENAKLLAIANGDYDGVLQGTKDADLGSAVYQKILGLNVELPTLKQVVERLSYVKSDFSKYTKGKTARVFKEKKNVAAEDLPLYAFVVPMLHGGRKFWNEWGHERCNDPRDMHLEPGDIIVRSENPGDADPRTERSLVYLGEGKYLMYDPQTGAYPIVEEPDFVASLIYGVFYCLRPTMAYDDIHANAGTASPAVPYKNPFTDVKETDWFYPFVKELSRSKKVNGTTATTYAPNDSLTYGQALKLIGSALGETESAKTGAHWASGWLELAKKNNWLTGKVDLDAPISRLAFCRIAAKAKSLTSTPKKNPFTDTKDKAVLALCKAGIISGMTETTFEPETLLTRAQIAKIILRLTLRK